MATGSRNNPVYLNSSGADRSRTTCRIL
jgi:hypothetical protein